MISADVTRTNPALHQTLPSLTQAQNSHLVRRLDLNHNVPMFDQYKACMSAQQGNTLSLPYETRIAEGLKNNTLIFSKNYWNKLNLELVKRKKE